MEASAFRVAGMPLAALLFLALTAAVSLVCSHYATLSLDEFYVLQTDSVPLSQLVRIQHAYPISLDPLLYHLIAHFSIRAFGPTAFALRLPSLLGYLMMQVCVFVFVRRIAGEAPAVLALALPALMGAVGYAMDGRPYGLLLGLSALALVSWQTAVRRRTQRTGALVALALAIALTLNTHYYGVLLLPALCLAELFRTIERRRVDLPVVAAIAAGIAGIAFVLPFTKAAGEFRKHYAILNQVSFHDITRQYRWLVIDYTHYSLGVQRAIAMGLAVGTGLLVFQLARQIWNKTLSFPPAEVVFVISLAGIPFFGYLLARYVTHVIELRYVVCAIVGMTCFAGIACASWMRQKWVARTVLAVIFVAIAWAGAGRIEAQRSSQQDLRISMAIAPQIKAAVLASPTGLLYIQDLYYFDLANYYEPDPAMRSRLALVYSVDQELRYDHHDTISLNALHMLHFTAFTIVPYERLAHIPGEHIFMLMGGSWDWTDQAFAENGVRVRPLGTVFGKQAAAVTFSASKPATRPGYLLK